MGVKHPKPHTGTTHKTHHQTGYHKPLRNPTTNYGIDTHNRFCDRCFKYNGFCPDSGSETKSKSCSL